MSSRAALVGLVTILVGAGSFAALRARSAPRPEPEAPVRAFEPSAVGATSNAPLLPPGHPAIGGVSGAGSAQATLPKTSDPPSIRWRAPVEWKAAVNPSSMRLETYAVPPAPGDKESADVSISRAGGTTDANIERWLSQFGEGNAATRTEKNVRGLKITILEVNGTYLGGGTMGAASAPHPGWALLGAIIEAPGAPYFMKVIGPAATVRSARASMSALLDTVTPI